MIKKSLKSKTSKSHTWAPLKKISVQCLINKKRTKQLHQKGTVS
jgi:hypothetical protein